MGFDTIFFLSCFLPITLALYYGLPGLKAKNIVLLALSLLFYAFGSISALLLLLAPWGVNYLLGLLVKNKIAPKLITAMGVTANLAYLFVFIADCYLNLAEAEKMNRMLEEIKKRN